jgi:putative DNA primase/helicase
MSGHRDAQTDENALLAAALAYAARGWQVLPLHGIGADGACTCGKVDCESPGKHPRTSHGLSDASTDAPLVTSWWGRWPTANIGVRTGPESGIFSLDIDSPEAAQALKATGRFIPHDACRERTGRGWQVIFCYPAFPVKSTTAKIAPDVDTKGDRGYFVAPPSRHHNGRSYAWLGTADPGPAPDWLLEELRPAPAAESPPPAPAHSHTAPPGQGYLAAALSGEIARVRGALVGTRNATLNLAAFSLGGLAHLGLVREEVEDALVRTTVNNGLAESASRATFVSGWEAGTRQPRMSPEPRDPHHQVMVAAREKADEGADTTRRFPRTDAGNGELFAYLNRDQLRYDHRRGRWLGWAGHHWDHDSTGAAPRLAIEAMRMRYRAAEGILDSSEKKREADFAIASENRHRLEALLFLARSLPPLADAGDQWDQDPFLLGVANGVVDLHTGTLRPGRPEDRVTLCTDIVFHAEATCPRWLTFIGEIFQGNEEIIDWLWRAVGYSLSGDTTEQVLFICHGQGANGKSVFLALLRALLGAYAYNAPFSTFELHRRGEISNDLAALTGARLITASETNEGARLNEARIKALTGGDPITARFLYGENFTFHAQGKVFLAVNHLPVVDDLSHGFWRRVRLLPFLRTFTTDADPHLEEKLRRELPGILAWAVRGCRAWQERGLTPPHAVLAATRNYREESDPLAEFLAEKMVSAENCRVLSAEAYGAYQTWARAQGMTDREILTSTAFGRKLGDRFPSKKSNRGKLYLGVGLLGAPVQEVLV